MKKLMLLLITIMGLSGCSDQKKLAEAVESTIASCKNGDILTITVFAKTFDKGVVVSCKGVTE